ncbi:MAG TPA: helix-turn-helix domain-containing protein, partial [Bellilinea sp.]|nr:helix-turn-helix domain-containing protein [Bellilinea sp.]
MDSNLAKSLQLIELILASPQGLSAQEIVDQADLSRSTVFTLLKSLIALGYLDQEGSRGKYFCGPKLQAWRNSPDTTDAELIARFNQEVKGRDWLESVFLIKHVGKVPLVIARHESLQPVRFSLSEGAPGASL